MCHVCGKTDLQHPQLDFRYCSSARADQLLCPEHIQEPRARVAAPMKRRPAEVSLRPQTGRPDRLEEWLDCRLEGLVVADAGEASRSA